MLEIPIFSWKRIQVLTEDIPKLPTKPFQKVVEKKAKIPAEVLKIRIMATKNEVVFRKIKRPRLPDSWTGPETTTSSCPSVRQMTREQEWDYCFKSIVERKAKESWMGDFLKVKKNNYFEDDKIRTDHTHFWKRNRTANTRLWRLQNYWNWDWPMTIPIFESKTEQLVHDFKDDEITKIWTDHTHIWNRNTATTTTRLRRWWNYQNLDYTSWKMTKFIEIRADPEWGGWNQPPVTTWVFAQIAPDLG